VAKSIEENLSEMLKSHRDTEVASEEDDDAGDTNKNESLIDKESGLMNSRILVSELKELFAKSHHLLE